MLVAKTCCDTLSLLLINYLNADREDTEWIYYSTCAHPGKQGELEALKLQKSKLQKLCVVISALSHSSVGCFKPQLSQKFLLSSHLFLRALSQITCALLVLLVYSCASPWSSPIFSALRVLKRLILFCRHKFQCFWQTTKRFRLKKNPTTFCSRFLKAWKSDSWMNRSGNGNSFYLLAWGWTCSRTMKVTVQSTFRHAPTFTRESDAAKLPLGTLFQVSSEVRAPSSPSGKDWKPGCSRTRRPSRPTIVLSTKTPSDSPQL